ncbi:MAG: PAS domain S-box protein [Spongiibacteraceae bacterium]|nr:PAS domain S-box protein [Spongiibacteraceae bacterium]
MTDGTLPFEGIVRGISEALIYADREGVIRWWSDGAEQLFGFSRDEALGQSLDLIIPEKLRAAHWRGFDAAIASGVIRNHGRIMRTRSLHKQADKIYVDMSFHLVTGDQGKVLGSTAIARPAAPPG